MTGEAFYLATVIDHQLAVDPYLLQIRRDVINAILRDIHVAGSDSGVLLHASHGFGGGHLVGQLTGRLDDLFLTGLLSSLQIIYA